MDTVVDLDDESWRQVLAQALLQAAKKSHFAVVKLILDKDLATTQERRIDLERIGRLIRASFDSRQTSRLTRGNDREILIVLTRYARARVVERVLNCRFCQPLRDLERLPPEIANLLTRFIVFPSYDQHAAKSRCIVA